MGEEIIKVIEYVAENPVTQWMLIGGVIALLLVSGLVLFIFLLVLRTMSKQKREFHERWNDRRMNTRHRQ